MIFDKNKFVRQWVEKAKEDKLVIERMTVPEIIAPAAVCFHCQQMVEKYLKAYLIFKDKEIIKTHNIEFLLHDCAEIDPEFSGIDVKNLSDFGVSARYPGEIYIPSDSETIEYEQIAFNIERIILPKLKAIIPGE
jgi:HEPN domain-containing protein